METENEFLSFEKLLVWEKAVSLKALEINKMLNSLIFSIKKSLEIQ